jgi:hypothetical protein
MLYGGDAGGMLLLPWGRRMAGYCSIQSTNLETCSHKEDIERVWMTAHIPGGQGKPRLRMRKT